MMALCEGEIKGFNTQPPEGGWKRILAAMNIRHKFQHTAARRRLEFMIDLNQSIEKFQHTAARRRLEITAYGLGSGHDVSTHSRPKAAGFWSF